MEPKWSSYPEKLRDNSLCRFWWCSANAHYGFLILTLCLLLWTSWVYLKQPRRTNKLFKGSNHKIYLPCLWFLSTHECLSHLGSRTICWTRTKVPLSILWFPLQSGHRALAYPIMLFFFCSLRWISAECTLELRRKWCALVDQSWQRKP